METTNFKNKCFVRLLHGEVTFEVAYILFNKIAKKLVYKAHLTIPALQAIFCIKRCQFEKILTLKGVLFCENWIREYSLAFKGKNHCMSDPPA